MDADLPGTIPLTAAAGGETGLIESEEFSVHRIGNRLTKKLAASAAWKGARRDRRPAQATRQATSPPSRSSARAPLIHNVT
jgi:hypothetical protein